MEVLGSPCICPKPKKRPEKPQFTDETRKVHNHLERERRKVMTQTIKNFTKVLPHDPSGRKDKTSILEAVINFFDLVYENVANIHELEKDFIRRRASSLALTESSQKRPIEDLQNSCEEPIAKYAHVDVPAPTNISEECSRRLSAIHASYNNLESYDLIPISAAVENPPDASQFGPYVDPPSTQLCHLESDLLFRHSAHD